MTPKALQPTSRKKRQHLGLLLAVVLSLLAFDCQRIVHLNQLVKGAHQCVSSQVERPQIVALIQPRLTAAPCTRLSHFTLIQFQSSIPPENPVGLRRQARAPPSLIS